MSPSTVRARHTFSLVLGEVRPEKTWSLLVPVHLRNNTSCSFRERSCLKVIRQRVRGTLNDFCIKASTTHNTYRPIDHTPHTTLGPIHHTSHTDPHNT